MRYLFGVPYNQIQRVGKHESKIRSEKQTIPLASRSTLRCMAVSRFARLVRRARPCRSRLLWQYQGRRQDIGGGSALARATTDGLRDSWHSGGLEKHLVGRELPVLPEDLESSHVQWERKTNICGKIRSDPSLFPSPSPHRPGRILVDANLIDSARLARTSALLETRDDDRHHRSSSP